MKAMIPVVTTRKQLKEIKHWDLTQGHNPVIIGGRKITFKARAIDGKVYFVPRGISRKPKEFGWRIWITQDNKEKPFTTAVFDGPHGGSRQSLQEAWKVLLEHIFHHPKTVRRAPGSRRRKFDPGYTGVHIGIYRHTQTDAPIVAVRILQRLKGKSRYIHINAQNYSNFSWTTFESAIKKAARLRSYYEHLVSEGVILHSPLREDSLPSNWPTPKFELNVTEADIDVAVARIEKLSKRI